MLDFHPDDEAHVTPETRHGAYKQMMKQRGEALEAIVGMNARFPEDHEVTLALRLAVAEADRVAALPNPTWSEMACAGGVLMYKYGAALWTCREYEAAKKGA